MAPIGTAEALLDLHDSLRLSWTNLTPIRPTPFTSVRSELWPALGLYPAAFTDVPPTGTVMLNRQNKWYFIPDEMWSVRKKEGLKITPGILA